MPQTTEQLRRDIDSGRTGSKVPASDPAAAPLGTDDEAAGNPAPSSAIGEARSYETSGPVHEPQRGLGAAWVLVVIILVMGGGLLLWALA